MTDFLDQLALDWENGKVSIGEALTAAFEEGRAAGYDDAHAML